MDEQTQPQSGEPDVQAASDQPAETTPAAPLPEPRLSRRAAWIAMGAVALALGLLWAASDLTGPPPDEIPLDLAASDALDDAKAIGKVAPLDYRVKDLNGSEVHLATFKGKIILLNFWATWCPPCIEEIPDFITLQDRYRDDIVVLGFSVDDTPEQVKTFAREHEVAFNYPVLLGLGHENIQEAYGPMWGIPVTIIIDRDGRIAKKQSGIRSLEQLDREIKGLL